MTAKSRRHKLDKKRKSDEHPQPRRREEADRRKEGARSRTGLIPRKREGHDASDESNEYLKAIVEAFNSGKAQLRGISLVPEGQGIPGSFIELSPTQQILAEAALRGDEVSIEQRVGRKGPYWNVEGVKEVSEPEVIRDELTADEFEDIFGFRPEDTEAVRTTGSPDFPTAVGQQGPGSPEEVLDAILEGKKRFEQPGSAYGTSPYLG